MSDQPTSQVLGDIAALRRDTRSRTSAPCGKRSLTSMSTCGSSSPSRHRRDRQCIGRRSRRGAAGRPARLRACRRRANAARSGLAGQQSAGHTDQSRTDPRIGMLFLIPGVDETLRVSGIAEITVEPALLRRWQAGDKQPKSAIRVSVREAILHCGKALIRSHLGKRTTRSRATGASYGQMSKDQIETRQTADEIEASVQEGLQDALDRRAVPHRLREARPGSRHRVQDATPESLHVRGFRQHALEAPDNDRSR